MIVGYKTNEEVLLATDSCIYTQDQAFPDDNGDDSSIITLSSNILVGLSSSRKVKQLFMINANLFHGKLTKDVLERKIVPDLFFKMYDQNLIDEDSIKDGRPNFRGMALFAQGDKLFVLDSDFSVITVNKYAVIGDECNIAAARLYENQDTDSAEQLLYNTLRDAEKYSRYVRLPFKLYGTKRNGCTELKEKKI